MSSSIAIALSTRGHVVLGGGGVGGGLITEFSPSVQAQLLEPEFVPSGDIPDPAFAVLSTQQPEPGDLSVEGAEIPEFDVSSPTDNVPPTVVSDGDPSNPDVTISPISDLVPRITDGED